MPGEWEGGGEGEADGGEEGGGRRETISNVTLSPS